MARLRPVACDLLARRMTGGETSAWDVMQDAFLRALPCAKWLSAAGVIQLITNPKKAPEK